jgi:YD repeat-containing protein
LKNIDLAFIGGSTVIRLTLAAHIRFMTLSARAGALTLLLLVFAPCLRAQQDAGATTPSVAPGSPAGSYALGGFESVNLYNGNLNFHLPLMQVGGRGAAGYTMTLPIEMRWSIFKNIGDVGIYGTPIYEAFYTPIYNNWYVGDKPGYGPGKLLGRTASYFPPDCNPVLGTGYTLMRLTFIAADGTEYELRDQSRDGQPWNVLCSNPGLSPRGRVFKSSDGTSVTFVSDTDITDFGSDYPSGYLMMRDGTRFRIDSGNVTWMLDRNGNKLSFIYDSQQRVTTITDSLNRQINISYYNPPSQTYDSITWKGYNNTQREIRVYYAALSTALRSDFSPGTMIFPPADPYAGNPSGANFDTTTVVSQVLLPNNQSYNFKYNPHLELAEVTLPTGGKYQYDWDAGPGTYSGAEGMDGEWGVPAGWPTPFDPSYTGAMYIYRRVTERRVRIDGSTLESVKTYNVVGDGSVTVNHLDASRNLQAQDKHYFYGSPFGTFSAPPTSYASWKEGREYQTEVYDTGGNLLRRVTHTWQQRAAVSWWPSGYPDIEPPNDPRIVETVTTLADANLVSKQTFGYDQYNNQTDVYEYGFGAGAPGSLIRRTHTDYVTFNNGIDYAGDYNIHIRSLPLQQQVFDAGGMKRAETLYEYDLYDNSLNHAPLIDRPGISGLDSGFTTGYTTRGNFTRTARTLLDNNGAATGWINTYAQYDIAGNVVKAIDANGNATTLDFSDRFGSSGNDAEQNTPPAELNGQTSYAFASKVTNALNHTTYAKYDYHLGKTVALEDANGVVSSVDYNDALDRPTQGIQARYKVGVGALAEKRQTTITYDDTNHVITTTGDRDALNDNILSSKSYYDGLGRTWRGAAYEGNSSWTIKDTQFDALGRVSQVSNPYRAADPGSALPPSGLWTTTAYDALSRPIKVTTPDGAHVDTAYNGNQVTVTDQAGKKRSSETDALGRLVKVTEDPGTGKLNYETTYFYDPLDNLRYVNQGGQGRWFAFDSLSRLIRARNLEQNCNPNLPPHTDPYTGGYCWSTAYSYDANGNLAQRIDARGVVTNYYYDALNRNLAINYINGSQTRSVGRFYDGAVNGKGRLYYEWTQEGGVNDVNATHYAIDSYDALGRPLTKRQHYWQGSGWGPGYYVQYTYDLAGNVKTQTYPSGHIVNYSYDQAGRISSFSGNLGGSPATYADTIGYNPAGQMIKERFGTTTSLYHNQHYNNRLQFVDTRLGDSATDEWNWSRGAIGFLYGSNAAASGNEFANDTDNNGNLRRQNYYVPLAGGGYVISQYDDYYYDALNRIAAVREQQRDANGQWADSVSQAYSYDRWGNRTLDLSGGGAGEVVWVDDALPAGASMGSDGGDSWTWVGSSPSPYSGTVSTQSNIAAGEHQHYFSGATQTLQVNAGDRLYAYVYLDPANMPQEVMLQWSEVSAGWSYKAYWGANLLTWPVEGTKINVGPLPAAGGWVRLEVPASSLGLEGKTLNGMAFTLYGGRANWDKAGKVGLFYGAGPPINNRVYTVDAGSNRLVIAHRLSETLLSSASQ